MSILQNWKGRDGRERATASLRYNFCDAATASRAAVAEW